MTATIALPRPRVLSDVIPQFRTRSLVLVTAGALLVALASQVRIPLGFTPVPVNGLTFASLVLGASYGARLGGAALGLFWVLGAVGLPFFQGGNGGWTYATGATGGYLVGAVLAAVVVGHLAERGTDRRLFSSLAVMAAANVLLIWVPGTLWLAHVLDAPVFGGADSAFALGVQPFIVGDLVKLALAGAALPTMWRLVGRSTD